MSRLWKQFSVEEKQKLFAAYKDEFEKNATSNQLLRTPAVMVLESWQNGNSPVAGSVGNKSDVGNQPGPSGQSVFLVRNLARKFNRLGMKKERRETLTLLEKMKPSSFSDNKEAQKAWVDELSALAEEYRTANQYLEAGRLYTYTATESEDWEKRAEALYKGGLLLYRSGRRQEAIEALTSASQDGNNLFYANLAKERLEQIQK
jgi:tetratricopeptide (TPR) repeat protein